MLNRPCDGFHIRRKDWKQILIIQILTYAIFLQAILSFIQPYSPIVSTLALLTSPIMQPLRRLIPPVGGMDLSPIPALIGLQLCNILLVDPLTSLGHSLII